ncbi:MAG: hypothetical protein WA814_13175 [Candidatus Baltobacteraceae bacterium]
MHPSTRKPTIFLLAGAAVLLIAVAIGERMGDRVIGQATEQSLNSAAPSVVAPNADATPQPYGPDWKRSQALSASGDPRFPDPRVPPQPLPTPLPPPPPRPIPLPTETPNPNVPIWRQKPLPTATPFATPSSAATELPSGEGSAQPSAAPPL